MVVVEHSLHEMTAHWPLYRSDEVRGTGFWKQRQTDWETVSFPELKLLLPPLLPPSSDPQSHLSRTLSITHNWMCNNPVHYDTLLHFLKKLLAYLQYFLIFSIFYLLLLFLNECHCRFTITIKIFGYLTQRQTLSQTVLFKITLKSEYNQKNSNYKMHCHFFLLFFCEKNRGW